jgi:hypothetical protein
MTKLGAVSLSVGIALSCLRSPAAHAGDEQSKKLTCKIETPVTLQGGPEPAELGFYGSSSFVTATVVPGTGIRLQLLGADGKLKSSRLVGGANSSHPVLSGVSNGQAVAWLDGKLADAPDEVWLTTIDAKGSEQLAPKKVFTFSDEERPAPGTAWLAGDLGSSGGSILWPDKKNNVRIIEIGPVEDPSRKSSVVETSVAPRSRPMVGGTPSLGPFVSWLAQGAGGKSDLMVARGVRGGKFAVAKLVGELDTPVDPKTVPGFGRWVVVKKGNELLGATALAFDVDFDDGPGFEVLQPPPGGAPTQLVWLEGAVAAVNAGGLSFGFVSPDSRGYVAVKGTKGKAISGLRLAWNSLTEMMATWREGSGPTATNRAAGFVCK